VPRLEPTTLWIARAVRATGVAGRDQGSVAQLKMQAALLPEDLDAVLRPLAARNSGPQCSHSAACIINCRPQFRPRAGGHFVPVDILGTLNTPRQCFRPRNPAPIHEKRVLLDLASALLARSNVTLSHRQAFRNDREDCAFLPTYEVGEIVSGEVSTPLRLVELAVTV
jgi:hypothetical protein